MLVRKLLLVFSLVFVCGNSQAWTLVYATDASGNVTSGSLQTLRTAVDNGSSVRVLVTVVNGNPWGMMCANTSLKMDASQAVVCASHQDLSMSFVLGSQFGAVSSPPYSAHFLANTSGQFVQANLSVATGEVLSTYTSNYPMRWYVD